MEGKQLQTAKESADEADINQQRSNKVLDKLLYACRQLCRQPKLNKTGQLTGKFVPRSQREHSRNMIVIRFRSLRSPSYY